MEINAMKRDVLKYYRRAYEDRLMAGTSGNASMYCPEQGLMVITPSGVDYRELTGESLAVMALDGSLISKGPVPSSEWRMHAAIYKKVKASRAVLHTHSEYATALAVVGMPIPEILIEIKAFLNGKVPVSGYAPAGSESLAEKVADSLAAGPACLMQNHGVCVYGSDMQNAYVRASYVEDAARIYCHALCIGKPLICPD